MEKIEALEKQIEKLEKQTKKMEKQLRIVMGVISPPAKVEEESFDEGQLDKIISEHDKQAKKKEKK